MTKPMQIRVDENLLKDFDALLVTRTRSQAIRDFMLNTVNKQKKV